MRESSVSSSAAFDWILMIWFQSAVTVCALGLELRTVPEVVAGCGENVTLTCDVSSNNPQQIKLFSWVGGKGTLCNATNTSDTAVGVECRTGRVGVWSHLSVTLLDVKTSHRGRYICKLHSTEDLKAGVTEVQVSDCPAAPGPSDVQPRAIFPSPQSRPPEATDQPRGSSGAVAALHRLCVLLEIILMKLVA